MKGRASLNSMNLGHVLVWWISTVLAIGMPDATVAQEVKKSSSGVCHCPDGQFYDRTTNFSPYDSLDACLASGGREPQRGQGDCGSAGSAPAPDAGAGEDNAALGGEVKKSRSGICHCPGGQFYERTGNFTPFETLAA